MNPETEDSKGAPSPTAMNAADSRDVLLISVGGAHAPVIVSIRQHRVRTVVFFVSPGSRPLVSDTILPALVEDPGRLPDHEFVVTPDEQDLGESVYTLLREVPAALRRLGFRRPWPNLVDYTAGTKTMSSALVLASARYPCRVSYIGTASPEGRNKGGLGVVVDGWEKVFRQENPWNRIAWIEARAAAELFNRGQYGNAADLLKQVTAKVDEEGPRRLYAVLAEVFQAFHLWDIFQHEQANRLLRRNLQPLQDLAQARQAIFPELEAFAETVTGLADVLTRIEPRRLSWEIIQDLLANARRRADLERKYEDAVARCYAAVERIAQHRLLFAHGIDASNAAPERLPTELREEYVRRYSVTDRSGRPRVRFGAQPAFRLLSALDDEIGVRYLRIEADLKSHMDQRNRSILAHGFDPMDSPKFEALFLDAVRLMGISPESLWRFPRLGM